MFPETFIATQCIDEWKVSLYGVDGIRMQTKIFHIDESLRIFNDLWKLGFIEVTSIHKCSHEQHPTEINRASVLIMLDKL